MSPRGSRLAAAALALIAAAPAGAWPVLAEARTAAGLRCFPDHADAARWWYLSERLELAERDGAPAFSLVRHRYLGSATTGDTDRFWARATLALEVRFATASQAVPTARAELERALGRTVSLEPLPLERLEAVVHYAGGADVSGTLDGADSTGPTWEQRSFAIGLEPTEAQIVWDAFHRGGLALSVAWDASARMLAARPEDRSSPVPDPAPLAVAGGALAVAVSPAACPECFASVDLDAGLPAEYPFLEVACFDFRSPDTPSDLGLVQVEVRAQSVGAGRLTEHVRFLPDGDPRMNVHFRLPVRLDRGFDYRVSRVYADGRVEADAWQERAGWSAILDVTRYRSATAALDPRLLY